MPSPEGGTALHRLAVIGDALNLYECAFGEGLHGHGTAGREGTRKEGGVHLVHGGEISHIGQENRGFDHVGKREARFLQDGLCVEDGLAGLLLDAAVRECARRGVDGKLSGKENQAGATADGLAVRAAMGSCPERKTRPAPLRMAWLYGPMAAGAFSVLIAFMLCFSNIQQNSNY